MTSPAADSMPYGYRVRFATSHHLGGWKPCAGPPKCRHCVKNEIRKRWVALRGCLPAGIPGSEPSESDDGALAAIGDRAAREPA